MYRIISNKEAALAIGAACGGEAPDEGDMALVGIIVNLLPKIEEALNVQSMVEQTWEDHFRLPRLNPVDGTLYRLRLSNGFLKAGEPVTLIDPAGVETVVNPDYIEHYFGYVDLLSAEPGLYKVRYIAGFTPTEYVAPDPIPTDPAYDHLADVTFTNPLLMEVPQWIKTAVIAYLIQWYRIEILAPKLPGKPEGRSALMLADAIKQEIYTRAYTRYMRQRSNCNWTYKSVVTVPAYVPIWTP